MRIAMIAIGSRGDVQPLLALGCELQNRGHEITIAAGANFREFVEQAGLAYHPMQTDIQAMMNSDLGREWIGSSNNPLKEAQNMRHVVDMMGTELAQDVLNASQDADCIVGGITSSGLTYTIAQKFGKKHILALFSPLHPTSSHAATMVPSVPKANIFLNRVSGYIAQYFMYWVTKNAVNTFRDTLGLGPLSFGEYSRSYNQNTPSLYAISPLVMPRPSDWSDHIHVTGYWFFDASSDWQPSPALQAFLDAGPSPVYIGFGSMTNKDPQATTRMMVEALKQSGQRGIIQSGWAGLSSDDLPDDIFLLDSAPHAWLFPRMAAVVHHGGAGTTSAALRAGVPSSVISHMADQPYWGQRIHDLGVGGPLIRRHQLTSERLADVIGKITSGSDMQARAKALGEQIRQEDGIAKAAELIDRL
jgi:UDP:flavonoid glycosyltransferase YjiC (YdhE family)